ncbi:MAG TPA: signal peptidase I [Verrucomicrobiae bacterium]|nr:signal peptidase I [Verrucomicrobiae bacterium]
MIRRFFSKPVSEACAMLKHVLRLLNAQRDLLSPQALAAVQLKLDELDAALAEKANAGKVRIKTEELQFAAEKWIKPYPHAAWRENVEVLLVALAVAMAIRTFFIQPFKIPTGSMQPTLFGIVSTPDFNMVVGRAEYFERAAASGYEIPDAAKIALKAEAAQQAQLEKAIVIPGGWERVKEWFQGISYLHVVAPADGTIDGVGRMSKFLIFNLKQTISIGGATQTMWFPPDYGEEDLAHRAGLLPGRVYKKGEDVIKMRISAGDHLFVDRLTYNFRKPERGEIIVFQTGGIPEEARDHFNIPNDQFWIKRLVALPGEHVQIGDDRHLIINGNRLDASTPHFADVYGFNPATPPRDSHYSGHVNGTVDKEDHLLPGLAPLFPDAGTVFTNGDYSDLVMGDNTCNSLDSRSWGSFAAQSVVGKSLFVYWPLTRRFGWGNE